MFARWRILCIELTEDIVVISSGRCIPTTVQWLRVFTNTTYIRWRTISAPTICHRLVYQRRRNLFSSDVNKSHELCYLRCFSFDYRHHSHTHTTPPGKRTHEQLKGKTFISFWFGAVYVCVCVCRHRSCSKSIWALISREVRIMARLCQVNMYLAAPFCLR